MAARPTPRAMAGMMTCLKLPPTLASQMRLGQVPGRYTQPELGNRPLNATEKTSINRMPRKKSGIEMPTRAVDMAL